jgi:short-subunit dehydrogenase
MPESTNRPFAVVTGASSGIGLELAKVFARNGYDVMIASEDLGINQAAREIEALGVGVEPVIVDLAKYEGVEELCMYIEKTGRPVDVVAINAGVGVGGDFTSETSLEAELDVIALNVTSSVHLAKRLLPAMVARNEGKVLFTSSIAGVMPAPFEAVYGASKAFIQSFSESLYNELKQTNITVTALQPGPTETNFFHRAGMDDTKVAQQKKDDPAQVAQQGFDALMAGKDHVVAGSVKSKMQAGMAKVVPQTTSAERHRRMSEPGSGDE